MSTASRRWRSRPDRRRLHGLNRHVSLPDGRSWTHHRPGTRTRFDSSLASALRRAGPAWICPGHNGIAAPDPGTSFDLVSPVGRLTARLSAPLGGHSGRHALGALGAGSSGHRTNWSRSLKNLDSYGSTAVPKNRPGETPLRSRSNHTPYDDRAGQVKPDGQVRVPENHRPGLLVLPLARPGWLSNEGGHVDQKPVAGRPVSAWYRTSVWVCVAPSRAVIPSAVSSPGRDVPTTRIRCGAQHRGVRAVCTEPRYRTTRCR